MINVKNLSYKYKNSSNDALNNISFNIEAGEIFGFLGPSGAGKTTTQRVIIGLLSDYDGSVEIFKKERKNMNKSFYENIGVAFDFPNLYLKLTAKENLELISSYYKKEPENIDDLLERVGLSDTKDKKVESFSKGMKMRLNFIRALVHSPDILFLDEPTSGLDPVNAKIIKDIILEQKAEGRTIFLTTHNMTVAEQLCDRVAFIVNGEIPIIEAPKQLMIDYGKKSLKLEFIENGETKTKEFDMDSIGSNIELEKIIKENKVTTIHSQEATLEEVFIKVTGQELI